MSKLGIVVEIEYHNYPNVPTGANLTSTASWYAGLASAFNGNPYVWFGSQNEPADPASAVTAMHVAVYNAIRATGNNTIIMHNLVGGYTTNGLTPSAYSSMTNIVWDCHYYNWISSYATDLGANVTALGKEIADAQSITSADGTVPVIIGEYGDSTDGENVDPGWVASVQAVLQSGYGTLAWHWNPGGGADWLLDPPFTGGQSQLTAYGQMVANFIAGKP